MVNTNTKRTNDHIVENDAYYIITNQKGDILEIHNSYKRAEKYLKNGSWSTHFLEIRKIMSPMFVIEIWYFYNKRQTNHRLINSGERR